MPARVLPSPLGARKRSSPGSTDELQEREREQSPERKHVAATMIQASERGRQGRRRVSFLKRTEADAAATKVQTCIRGRQAKVKVEKKLEKKLEVQAEARAQDKWDLLLWVQGAQVYKAVTAVLQQAMSQRGVDGSDGDEAFRFVQALRSRAELLSLLSSPNLLEHMTDLIWEKVDDLQTGPVGGKTGTDAIVEQTYSKFSAEGIGFKLSYGGLSTFFGGLEAKIGSPDPQVLEAMRREHQSSADSNDFFTTGNYGITTTPHIEWRFVAEPDDPPEPGGWPVEERLRGRPEDADKMRTPLSKAQLKDRLERTSRRLRDLGEPELIIEEVIGGRQYTGPMFVKYNDLLRNFGGALQGCKDNKYVTTTHVINSCIVKVGKLTKAAKVYRGISGGMLPEEFWTPNEQGIRGGVEAAFMSTTYDRKVAMHYASAPGRPALLFEMQMGMVDRGCELDWISQYPHEKEVLFNPLTGLEVMSKRFEGMVLVVEIKLSVNLNAMTIEQVVGKRRKLLVDMTDNMQMEVKVVAARKARGAEAVFGRLLKHTVTHGALDANTRSTEWYNDDEHFKKAVDEVMSSKRAVLDDETRCELMSPKQLRQQKHKAHELRAAGYVAGMKEGGYSFAQAVEAGYKDVEELRRAGYAPCPDGGGLVHEHDWGFAANAEDGSAGAEGGRCVRCGERRFAVNPDLWRRGSSCVVEAPTKVSEGFNMLRSFPDDSRLLASGSAESKREVTVYNHDLSVAGILKGHTTQVRSVAVDKTHIATGDSFGGIRLWKTYSLQPAGEPLPMEHGGKIFGLAISGDTLLSGGADKMAKVWSVSKRSCVATLSEHSHAVFCVDFTSEYMATASHDLTVRIWPSADSLPPQGAKSVHTLPHPDLVVAVEVERDVLATACDDKIVRTFSLSTGRRTREMHGHSGTVFSVAICGSVLLSGSLDRTVKVWSLDTADEAGECVTTIEGQTGAIKGVTLSPAGGFAASLSAGDQGKLVVWRPASLMEDD